MIILIAIIPAKFAIDQQKSPEKLLVSAYNIEHYMHKIQSDSTISIEDKKSCEIILAKVTDIKKNTDSIKSFDAINNKTGFSLRKDINSITKESKILLSQSIDDTQLPLTKQEIKALKSEISSMKDYTEYAPIWVIVMISLSLGIGTMVGWKRIVVTVGEKIGKTPLNYAQGASAELVTASTIGIASALGLPVSTTHVLSSGIAGSMVAQQGLKNLRKKTIKSIAIAWLVTLPVTIVMSGLIFLLLRAIMG
jgi:PiT family inorganic phosphate transporter